MTKKKKRGARLSPVSVDLSASSYSFGGVVINAPIGSRLDVLCAGLRDEFPALVLSRKSRWWWFWSPAGFTVSLGFAGMFVLGLSTAVWKDIDARPQGWDDRVWTALSHERLHLRRWRRLGLVVFLLVYGLFFLPAGIAWGRAWIEREGYLETLRCWFALDPAHAASIEARDWWVSRFTGTSYLWMWPFKKQVRRWYDTELVRLREEARRGSRR